MMILSPVEIKQFQKKIINWFELNGRDFPWRKTDDVYKILVSEILLQKTNVRKVPEVYLSVIKQYPTIKNLSSARLIDLQTLLRPIGLLYRAERLIGIAKKINQDYGSIFPKKYEEWLAFTGIGNYIASAIVIFAYKEKRVLVDTNVIRVFSSEFFYNSRKSRARCDPDLMSFAQQFADSKKIREFNWGLLDYGAYLSKKNNSKLSY